MIIILPREGLSLRDFHQSFTYEEWLNGHNYLLCKEPLPCQNIKLNMMLHPMNHWPFRNGDGFTGEADFTRMVENGGVNIDEVRHKSFIEVNEEGTEAAAATSVAVTESASIDAFTMTVNRPFLFAIKDNHSNMILFLGAVTQPE